MSTNTLKEKRGKVAEIQDNENTKLVEDIFDSKRLNGTPTGLTGLDDLLGGLKARSLTILAGSTGVGKSILGLTILINLAKEGHKVSYFDLENGAEESFQRILTSWFGVTEDWFRDESNKNKAGKMIDVVKENFDYWGLEDLVRWGFAERGYKLLLDLIKARVLDANFKAEFILVDPLQSLESQKEPTAALNEQGLIVRAFKDLAQTLGVSVVICHHIRKSTQSGGTWIQDISEIEPIKYRVPTLEDLKGSSKIADFSHVVLGLVRTSSSTTKEGRSKSLLRILKNRMGNCGDIKLFFDEDLLKFSDGKDTPANQIFDLDNDYLNLERLDRNVS